MGKYPMATIVKVDKVCSQAAIHDAGDEKRGYGNRLMIGTVTFLLSFAGLLLSYHTILRCGSDAIGGPGEAWLAQKRKRAPNR